MRTVEGHEPIACNMVFESPCRGYSGDLNERALDGSFHAKHQCEKQYRRDDNAGGEDAHDDQE